MKGSSPVRQEVWWEVGWGDPSGGNMRAGAFGLSGTSKGSSRYPYCGLMLVWFLGVLDMKNEAVLGSAHRKTRTSTRGYWRREHRKVPWGPGWGTPRLRGQSHHVGFHTCVSGSHDCQLLTLHSACVSFFTEVQEAARSV